MKVLISTFLGFILVSMVVCQRPPYAPLPVRYPDVAPRFRTQENQNNENVGLANRNSGTDESTTTVKLPIDALGNVDVVNQINRWPEERRPFWYVNSEVIEESRSRPFPAPGQNVQVNVPARSPFLGSTN